MTQLSSQSAVPNEGARLLYKLSFEATFGLPLSLTLVNRLTISSVADRSDHLIQPDSNKKKKDL